jgi:hypothetical protein
MGDRLVDIDRHGRPDFDHFATSSNATMVDVRHVQDGDHDDDQTGMVVYIEGRRRRLMHQAGRGPSPRSSTRPVEADGLRMADTDATHHLDKIRVDLSGILTHRVHAAVSPAALRDLGLPEFEASTWWNA